MLRKLTSAVVPALAAGLLGLAVGPLAARAQNAPSLSTDQVKHLAKVHVEISAVRDSVQEQLAMVRNKTEQAQQELREKLLSRIDEILKLNSMTEAEYQRQTLIVSSSNELLSAFDDVVAELTGAPTSSQLVAAAAARAGGAGGRGGGAQMPLPPGMTGTHIGHVVNSFSDTPGMQGLLPVATSDARVAAQHAELASRNSSSLDAMKTHAGHVLHALDPSMIAQGPGSGYGVKKAATGVATHIELAAGVADAPANVRTHAVHIATSARNTVQRADQLIALAQQVQAATSAEAAAAIVSQMVSLSGQLIAGADANNDGRVSWEQGEGGLQHCQEHVELMLGGANR